MSISTQRSARGPYATAVLDIGRNWWREIIIYEVYVQSFQDSNQDGIGDLPGVKMRLDYLKRLGADMIWLTPVYKSPLKDQGYDISDYEELNPQIGTMGDFEDLVEAAHEKDMRIMLDVVFNHTSDQHSWFEQSRSRKNNPKRDWYFWRPGRVIDGKEVAPNNWSSLFGGPAWSKDERTGEWYLHLFSPAQPDLNWDTPALREAIADTCRFWLKKGVDGFRMDVINLISKTPGLPDAPVTIPDQYEQPAVPLFTNGPNVHQYLHELNKNVFSTKDICTVGEMPCGVDPFEASLYVAHEAREIDMVFQFAHIDLDATNGNKWIKKKWEVPQLEKIFRIWQQHMLGNHGWNALYLENHDQARSLARFGNQDPKYRVVCAKMLCTMLLTMRGTPFIMQGQELGCVHPKSWTKEEMRDVEAIMRYEDEYNKRKKKTGKEPDMSDIMEQVRDRSRDNVRTPMPWCPPSKNPHAGFSEPDVKPWIKMGEDLEHINVESEEKDPNSVLNYWKKLINLRKSTPSMFYGTYVPLSFDHTKVWAYLRCQGPFRTFIILNFTAEDGVTFDVTQSLVQIDMAVLFISNYQVEEIRMPKQIRLRPYEARVYALREQIA